MKILVVCQFYYPEPFRIHEITSSMVRRGHSVTVITTYPNYPEGKIYDGYSNDGTKKELKDGVVIYRIYSRPRMKGSLNLGLSFIDFYKKANKFVRNFKDSFDIVYSYQLSPVMQVIPAYKYARRNNIPLYVYCLDIWPDSILDVFPSQKSIFYKLVKWWSRSIYSKADMIGITSVSFKDYLINKLGLRNIPIEYRPQHSDDVKGNENFDKHTDGCDIFFMGNIGESQNFDMIIDAVKLVRHIDTFKLHIVGEGSMYNHTVERVQQEGLGDKIVFYGRRPYSEMPQFYKMADACLLTLTNKSSIGMTVPGKLQNYMAAGKPIIASIGGDSTMVIEAAHCGIVAIPDDSTALANAFVEFVNNKDKYSICGNNARKYYLANYTLDKHIDRLEEDLLYLVRSKA